jgi:hypothetical protein
MLGKRSQWAAWDNGPLPCFGDLFGLPPVHARGRFSNLSKDSMKIAAQIAQSLEFFLLAPVSSRDCVRWKGSMHTRTAVTSASFVESVRTVR